MTKEYKSIVVDRGSGRSEVPEMAIYMGDGPSLMYAADALRSFDRLK